MSPSITSASAVESPDVRPLDRRIVKVIEIIESGDSMSLPQEPSHDMGTDEAGAAGDKNLHRVRLIGLRKSRQGISTLFGPFSSSQPNVHRPKQKRCGKQPWRQFPSRRGRPKSRAQDFIRLDLKFSARQSGEFLQKWRSILHDLELCGIIRRPRLGDRPAGPVAHGDDSATGLRLLECGTIEAWRYLLGPARKGRQFPEQPARR